MWAGGGIGLSSRVLINVHHDFGIEPHTGLAAAPKRRRRRDVADLEASLGFEPLDVFDLWQRELGRPMVL